MSPANEHRDSARIAREALRDWKPEERPIRGLVGFDGFVDVILRAVDTRRSMVMSDFEAIATLSHLSKRIGKAAGRSANIELVRGEERFGGNGPLLAFALASLGGKITFVGGVGQVDAPRDLDPRYQPLADRCAAVHPVTAPGTTLALEFDDGKLMFNLTEPVSQITWDDIVTAVGIESLRASCESAHILGVVNWSLLGGVEGIWEGLAADVLPGLAEPAHGTRRIFIDLSDPQKRSDEDVARAMTGLQSLSAITPVTLGLNVAEAERIARVCGADDLAMTTEPSDLRTGAERLQDLLGLACVVIHSHHGAGAASESESAHFAGAHTPKPVISTGAGDHFNAGVAFGQALDLPLGASLAIGCGVGGAYVRDGKTPSLDRTASLLKELET